MLADNHELMKLDDFKIMVTEYFSKNDFDQTIKVSYEMLKQYPTCDFPYFMIARSHMGLQRYKLAYDILKIGEEKFPESLGILVCYSDYMIMIGDTENALHKLKYIICKFPHLDVGYRNIAYLYYQIGDLDTSIFYIEKGLCNVKDTLRLFKLYINIALLKKSNFLVFGIYARMLTQYPKLIREKFIFAQRCALLAYENESYKYIYNVLVEDLFSKFNIETSFKYKSENLISFFTPDIKGLTYYLPVIKKIPPSIIDIIVENKHENDHEKSITFGINSYNIYYGKDLCKRYKCTVLDGMIFQFHDDYSNINKCIISLPHGADISPRYKTLNNSDLCIVSSKNQISLPDTLDYKLLSDENIFRYSKIKSKNKCEIAYTGPYHTDDSSSIKSINKTILSEKLKIKIPENKPLCVFFEDEISSFGQIVYCINKISKFCTVIFKPYFSYTNKLMKKISSDIFIVNDKSLANNELRYAADFILAGYTSGTCASSVMLKLNIIPYYSRYVKSKVPGSKLFPFTYFFNSDRAKFYDNDRLKIKLIQSLKLFDLLDIKSLHQSITTNEYISWYNNNISYIQKYIFGDYCLDGSSEKTAELILKFAINKTLGEECEALYLNYSNLSS